MIVTCCTIFSLKHECYQHTQIGAGKISHTASVFS